MEQLALDELVEEVLLESDRRVDPDCPGVPTEGLGREDGVLGRPGSLGRLESSVLGPVCDDQDAELVSSTAKADDLCRKTRRARVSFARDVAGAKV